MKNWIENEISLFSNFNYSLCAADQASLGQVEGPTGGGAAGPVGVGHAASHHGWVLRLLRLLIGRLDHSRPSKSLGLYLGPG